MNNGGLDLEPFGDRAWLARFASDALASSWAEAVRDRAWPGVIEVVAAYHSVAIHVDPSLVDPEALEPLLRTVSLADLSRNIGRVFHVPVHYDGEDLIEVSEWVGLSASEVIGVHSGIEYSIRAIGFLPGFPYLGELPDALAGLPRRATPRTNVPAGSVAIAGRQSCIYPQASPGGWHLIGRTPLILADLTNAYLPMKTGDRVRFMPIDHHQYQELRGCRLDEF